MNIAKKIVKGLRNPQWGVNTLLRHLPHRWVGDRAFVRWEYCHYMGHWPDLDNPGTFNEKLQWLKLNCRRGDYALLVDKYEAKEKVRAILGDDFVIPTLGVWSRFEDIDFSALPQQFVLKTTHDQGGEVIVRDKDRMDMEAARRKIKAHLRRDYFMEHREYPYRTVPPRVLAEQYMEDKTTGELRDYKFFCFDGRCRMILVCTDRAQGARYGFFDTDFRPLPFKRGKPLGDRVVERPAQLERMIAVAEKLAQGMPHVRIDLYDVDGHIYFGEYTFFSAAGSKPFEPEEWDTIVGSWLTLPKP